MLQATLGGLNCQNLEETCVPLKSKMQEAHLYKRRTIYLLSWSSHSNHGKQVLHFTSVQSLSHVGLFPTPWTAVSQASLSITNSRSLPKLTSIESVMPSNHFILCRPLLLPPSIFPSIRVFSNESALHIRWPKYWSISFNISPSNEYSGLISFRMYWLDLLAVQWTLKSLLQYHSSKTSITYYNAKKVE